MRGFTALAVTVLAACASSTAGNGGDDVDSGDNVIVDADTTDAPVSIDADCSDIPCDGIYVHPGGNDSNPGTKAMPMQTLGAAMARAETQNKAVLVAAGTYAE